MKILIVKKNASLKSFLIIPDLNQFEAAFQSEGITKVEHVRDVTNKVLKKICLYKMNFFTRSLDVHRVALQTTFERFLPNYYSLQQ